MRFYSRNSIAILVFALLFALLAYSRTHRLSLDDDPIIPRHIIQTHVQYEDIWDQSRSFKELNPKHTYLFFNDDEADRFVRRHMPDTVIQAYAAMPMAVLKADFFRYIAVYVLGGVYSDLDTTCLRPIDTWTDDESHVGMIVGIEAESATWKRDFARPLQLCQWTFAARPGHPILKRIIDKIANYTSTMANRTMSVAVVMDWTGPGIWTDTVFDYLNETYHFQWPALSKLEHGRLVGDVYVLPVTAFQPNGFDLGGKGERHPDARVKHHFAGSWKRHLPQTSKRRFLEPV